MKKEEIITLAQQHGYVEHLYGYRKITINIIHFITVFHNNSFQMYGYYKNDSQMEKTYDTGIIKIFHEDILKTFMATFITNHQ